MKRLKETLAKNAWYFAGVLAEIALGRKQRPKPLEATPDSPLRTRKLSKYCVRFEPVTYYRYVYTSSGSMSAAAAVVS